MIVEAGAGHGMRTLAGDLGRPDPDAVRDVLGAEEGVKADPRVKAPAAEGGDGFVNLGDQLGRQVAIRMVGFVQQRVGGLGIG